MNDVIIGIDFQGALELNDGLSNLAAAQIDGAHISSRLREHGIDLHGSIQGSKRLSMLSRIHVNHTEVIEEAPQGFHFGQVFHVETMVLVGRHIARRDVVLVRGLPPLGRGLDIESHGPAIIAHEEVTRNNHAAYRQAHPFGECQVENREAQTVALALVQDRMQKEVVRVVGVGHG